MHSKQKQTHIYKNMEWNIFINQCIQIKRKHDPGKFEKLAFGSWTVYTLFLAIFYKVTEINSSALRFSGN